LQGGIKGNLRLHMLTGLLIRELFAAWTGHPWDFEVWVRVGKHVALGENPYTILHPDVMLSFSPFGDMESIGYPPLSAYFFAFGYVLYSLINLNTKYVYYFLLKQPMIIADVLIGRFLYRYSENLAILFWIYNPYVILVSSIWGAIDPIAILFTLLGLECSLKGKRDILASAFLSLAISIKGLPAIFIPHFLRSSVNPSLSMIMKRFVYLIAITSVLIAGPFILHGWAWKGFQECVSYQASPPTYGGISPLLSLEYVKKDLPPLLNTILSLLWVPAVLASYVKILRWDNDAIVQEIYYSAAVTVSIFIISRPFASEPWLLYPIAFMLMRESSFRKARLRALTALGLLNLTINNTLLLWFASPLDKHFFEIAHFWNNNPPYEAIRLALRQIAALLLLQEILALIFEDPPLLDRCLRKLRSLSRYDLIRYGFFLTTAPVLGFLLDYIIINMITDWKHVLEKGVFMGLNFLSIYHLLIAMIFFCWIVSIVLSRESSLARRLKEFLILTGLLVVISGCALPIFQLLRGSVVLGGELLELVGPFKMNDVMYFVSTTSVLGVLPAITDLDTIFLRFKNFVQRIIRG